MKRFLSLFTILSCCVLVFAQQSVSTKIDDVLVFRKGALVERTGKVNLKRGNNILSFIELSPTLDPQSVRVSIDSEDLRIVSVNHEQYFKDREKNSKENLRQERIKMLKDSLAMFSRNAEVLNEEKQLILANKQIGGDKGFTAADLSGIAQYYVKELTVIGEKLATINEKSSEMRLELKTLMQGEKNDQKDAGSLSSKVIVVVESEKQQAAVPVSVSYLVADASWTPFYDVRFKNPLQPLNLAYSARVKQSTDEDWNNVRLTLSTNDPSVDNTPVSFQPLYLPPRSVVRKHDLAINNGQKNYMVRGVVSDMDGELPGANVTEEGTTNSTTTGMDGKFELKMTNSNNYLKFSFVGNKTKRLKPSEYMDVMLEAEDDVLNEMVVVGYGVTPGIQYEAEPVDKSLSYEPELRKQKEKKIKVKESSYKPFQANQTHISTEFKIELPYSIPADNEEYAVGMIEYEIPAGYEYITSPRWDKNVFLVAQINDYQQLNMLEGKANLYLKNVYQGQCMVSPSSTDDTLSISLGRDKDVAVTRQEVKSESSSNLFGTSRTVRKTWEIVLKNNQQSAVTVNLDDQYPISNASDIKVTLIDAGGAKIDAETGKLTWKVSLSPMEKKIIRFSYEVKYPKHYSFIVE